MIRDKWCLLGSVLVGSVVGVVVSAHYSKRMKTEIKKSEKFAINYEGLREWLALKQAGKGLSDYFEMHGITHIAIYAMGDYGYLLHDELRNSNIEVDYVIDRNPLGVGCDVDIYSPNDILPDTQMVIITVPEDCVEIKQSLNKKLKCPVVSIWEAIYEV